MKIAAIMAGGMDGDVESGRIGEVVAERGAELVWFYRRYDQGLPDVSQYDALIVFGGEPSVYDPQLKNYFDRLADCIHQFYRADKAILGSCLGCQSIAYAFGGQVKPQGFLEYGFTSLQLCEAAADDALLKGLDSQQRLFEMHSDTFDLPAGAVPLLRGDKVINQGFRLGNKTWAFQCHFEVTPAIVDTWTRRELVGNPNHNESVVARLIQQVDQDFNQYQQAQTAFARTLVNRWLDVAGCS
ncbi:type 1 glutamine amidotransferase [Oceanobacter mangrovi]|uniref:type 1 glutamine amidotransferase n=1 Tax=Oceanobacter mangrovi TaxID=2862510 RepID=UPI001C8DD071|nr:type 1 glutamine amidotransferase [Oceanobacter mangrovi]